MVLQHIHRFLLLSHIDVRYFSQRLLLMFLLVCIVRYNWVVVIVGHILLTYLVNYCLNMLWNGAVTVLEWQWLCVGECLEDTNDTVVVVHWNCCKSIAGVPNFSFQPSSWCNSWWRYGELYSLHVINLAMILLMCSEFSFIFTDVTAPRLQFPRLSLLVFCRILWVFATRCYA